MIPKICIAGGRWARILGCLDWGAIGEYETLFFGQIHRIYIGNWHWVEKSRARDPSIDHTSFAERIRSWDDDASVAIDLLYEEVMHYVLDKISVWASVSFDNFESELRRVILNP